MELRHLQHFVAVAEEANFTQAARRMHIAQSGLSASVKALERDLGADLFTRSTHGVVLTDAGRVLLVEARRTLAAAREAQDAVAAVQGLRRGTLTIGVHPHRRKGVDLPAILQRFSVANPGVEIRLRQAVTAVLVEELRTGLLDVAFMVQFGVTPPDIAMSRLGADSLALVCAPGHPLAKRGQVTVADLIEQPFIRLVGTDRVSAHTMVDEVLNAANVLHRIRFEVNDIQLLLDLVERGLGVALLADGDAECSSSVVRVPLAPAVRWDTVIATAAEPATSAAARALLSLVIAPAHRADSRC